MVPTASHREATALAPYVNLARGWNRQADASRNRLFYRDRPLTADAYQHWLRRWAVRFVVLSQAAPDAAAKEEAALVAGGLPYLEPRLVGRPVDALRGPGPASPLASAPAEVLDFDSAEVTLWTPTAGPDRGPHRLLPLAEPARRRRASRCPDPPTATRRPSRACPALAGDETSTGEARGELAGPARHPTGRLPDRRAVQDAARLRLPVPD